MMTDLISFEPLFTHGTPLRDEYLTSLLSEAVQCGLLTAEEESAIRRSVMELLAQRIRLYTDGESTAVREETAQMLLSSILYTVGIALLEEGSHEAALHRLKTDRLEDIHDAGMLCTMRTKKRAELLVLLMLKTQLPERSTGYNRFVGRDARNYVYAYDPLYDARAELYVRIDELSIRETCRGILRIAEIMTQVIKYNQKGNG